MIFDTHAHYDDERFLEDQEELLASLKEKNVGTVVNVGASLDSTRTSIALAEKYDWIYAAAGIHPDGIPELKEEDMDWLRSLTKHPKVVAIGEIGLDYFYDEPDKDLQKEWFAKQLQVAVDTDMPVIIHSREAAKDTLDLIKQYKAEKVGGVIHCFSYSVEMADIYLNMGFYLGIGGILTFKKTKKLKEVVKMAPLERLVLETDAPYLTPVPFRGKRNESDYLQYVAEEIARIKEISPEEVIAQTERNARKMYRLNFEDAF